MLFYDIEVFKYDWIVVIIDVVNQKEHVIVNDKDKLETLYKLHKNDIWVGYNSRQYDQYVLQAILCGFNPKAISDFIILGERPGWMFSTLLREYPINNYDVMPNPPISLKTLEGFMGNNIKETDVPFDINRKLTEEEINETIKYCKHDVEQTIEVFLKRKSEFDAMFGICKIFNLPIRFVGKTEAMITAKVLDCEKKDWKDEFDYSFLDCIKLNKYKFVLDWFKNAVKDTAREMCKKYNETHSAKYDCNDKELFSKYFYSRSLTVDVANVPHTFGFGGLHGAPLKPIHRKGLILHVDVGSYYPSMLIAHNLITRSAKSPERYKNIYDTRMELKRAKKKLEQAPYKKLLNALSGAMKDKNNPAYDPRNNNIMCINGQLMLLDLIEKLEVVPGFELLQSNTDGLIIMIPNTDEAFYMVDDICYDWETRCSTDRCKILLELDMIDEIYQKDVNNYLWIDDKKGERKGAYVKELSSLDADLPIINKALVDFMQNKTPIETTINNCNELMMFQKIVKLSSNYTYVIHNGRRYTYKSYRVFASKGNEGMIYKCGGIRGSKEKFANTPNNCFIFNDNVIGVKCPPNLDKNWYIELARERLRQFGVEE